MTLVDETEDRTEVDGCCGQYVSRLIGRTRTVEVWAGILTQAYGLLRAADSL